jgi:methionyl-tRNA formyltransferase
MHGPMSASPTRMDPGETTGCQALQRPVPFPKTQVTIANPVQDQLKARVDFNRTAQEIHDWIRGNDRVPGAWAIVNGQVTGC